MPVKYNSGDSFFQTLTGTLVTVGAVADAIITFTIPVDSTASVTTTVAGLNDGVSESAGYVKHSVFRRTAAGGLGQIGETDISDLEDVAGWDVNVVVNGANIEVQVTGAAGSTVSWSAVSKILIITL